MIIHKIKDLANPMQAHPLGVGEAGVACLGVVGGGERICHKKERGSERGSARLGRLTAHSSFSSLVGEGGLTHSTAGN